MIPSLERIRMRPRRSQPESADAPSVPLSSAWLGDAPGRFAGENYQTAGPASRRGLRPLREAVPRDANADNRPMFDPHQPLRDCQAAQRRHSTLRLTAAESPRPPSACARPGRPISWNMPASTSTVMSPHAVTIHGGSIHSGGSRVSGFYGSPLM